MRLIGTRDNRISACAVVMLGCVLLLADLGSLAARTTGADERVSVPQTAQATPADGLPLPKRKPFVVEGFRSARFGMDERAVRRAIGTDLKVSSQDIKKQVIRTGGRQGTLLAVQVKDLLPDSGTAEIVYLLDVEGRDLREVHVHWGDPVDREIRPEQLVAVANALRSYFQQQGYDPETVVVNRRGTDGRFLVFNGNDVAGRNTRLILAIAGKDEEQVEREWKNYLRLSYLGRPAPAAPKVQIREGQF